MSDIRTLQYFKISLYKHP